MPKRIQRKRTKGWRMPEGAVYVGRPTRWGNPFHHTEKFYGRDVALRLFRNTIQGVWSPSAAERISNVIIPYEAHTAFLKRLGGHPLELIEFELGGKDLACWCPLDAPCHADILLEFANSGRYRREFSKGATP